MVASVRGTGRRGFTLIELMVVVAIITLLISIIIPSLAASRENVRSVLCRTNLTELSKAILMYSQAHRGTLPFEDRPNSTFPEQKDYVCWYDAVDKYLQTGVKDNPLKDKPATGENKGSGVKLCPTVARDLPNSPESFRMNSKLAETNKEKAQYYKPFRKIDQVPKPLASVLLFDGDVGGPTLSFKGRWRLTRDDVDYRHNVKTNLLFVGGNIENLLKKVVAQRSVENSPIIWQQADLGPWAPDAD